jgi:glycosyltransferase involved in cell wall biosynthesis
MRCELFRRAAGLDFDVDVVVVPVAGGACEPGTIEVTPDGARARAGLRSLLAEPVWRERLAGAGRLPRGARAASPGLADTIAQALGEGRFDALHVMRAYLAPLGVALGERLAVPSRTLDLDDDDVAVFSSVYGERGEASAYERLVGVFGGLYGGLCAASPIDAGAIAERHGLRVEHVPNAVEIPRRRPTKVAAELRLLFVGNLTYLPNVQAAQLLVNEVLPRLRERLGGVALRVTLAGPACADVQRLACASVRVCGFVDDLGELYAEADVVLAPLRGGGGTRTKLLEAFAHGVPVVATPAAAEGLALADGRELLLGADVEQLVAAVAALASDAALGARLVEQAGRLVRERYSHDAVIPRVRDFLTRGAAREHGEPQPVLSS